jgi:hypothetical protein
LVPNEDFYNASANALRDAAAEGSLVVSDIVYAELCMNFEIRGDCNSFLESNDTHVQARTREAHFIASRAWRQANQNPGRLIGAHALKQAAWLLSCDRGFYYKLFLSLVLHDPSVLNQGDSES